VNYVSENTSAHNAHQPPTDNTLRRRLAAAAMLRARKNCREWAAENEAPERTTTAPFQQRVAHFTVFSFHGADYHRSSIIDHSSKKARDDK
jgi:hypothetical protein